MLDIRYQMLDIRYQILDIRYKILDIRYQTLDVSYQRQDARYKRLQVLNIPNTWFLIPDTYKLFFILIIFSAVIMASSPL